MSKNRGNPNWGKSMTIATGPSSFEQLVKQLGLTPEQYQGSAMLKEWVTKHKDNKYVPQDVLQLWGFPLS
jgi:hypothetical protein